MRHAFALALALAAAGCGGRLGEPSDAPLPGAEQLARADDLAFATAEGELPGFLPTQPFTHAGALHFVVSGVPGTDTSWVDAMRGPIRLRAAGVVYRARAEMLEGADRIDPVLPALLAQQGMQPASPHFVGTSERYPGTQVLRRYFRVEPAPAGPSAP